MVRNKLRNTLENTFANKGLDALKALRLAGYDRDYIEETGPYLAQVLRVEPLVGTDTWVDSAVTNAAIDFGPDGKPSNPLQAYANSFVVTARISSMEGRQIGIHDYLPEPEQFGTKEDLKGDFKSETAIFNHDYFVPQSLDLPAPELGSYIWVDYLDKQNLEDGIYIKPMTPGDSVIYKTKKDDCPPPYPTTGKRGKGAATGKDEKNPGLGKAKGQPKPEKVVSRLHGYKLEDFTQSDSFKKEPKKQNLLKMVGVAEVITMFFKLIYPKSEIKIIAPNAGRDSGQPEPPELGPLEAAKKCYEGKGLRVKVHKDGKPLPKEEVYGAMVLLILKGKLPQGGLGFFQTNAGDGTNQGTPTTLGTNAKASDFPHYDLRQTPTYWIVSTKDNEQQVTAWKSSVLNWINSSKKGYSKTNLPPHAYEAYIALDTKHKNKLLGFPNLDTTLAAIDKKQKIPKGSGVADPNNKEKTPDAAATTPNNNNAEKPADEKKEKEKEKEENKDKAKKDQTPQKVPVAQIPCPPPDGDGADTDGGAGGQDLAAGSIGKTAGKPPKGQQKNDKLIMQHFGEKEKNNNFFKQKNNKLSMFILHYTAGDGPALQMASDRKKKILSKIKENGGKNAGFVETTSYTVHLWMGRAGDWFQQVDFMHKLGHAHCTNPISIGMENCHSGYQSSANKTTANKMSGWMHFVGPKGNIAPKLFASKELSVNQNIVYGLPSLAQLENNYQMCKWITGFTGRGKKRNQGPYPPEYMNIPMAFPATSSPNADLSAFNKPLFNGKDVFIWGRVNFNSPNGKGTGLGWSNTSAKFWESRKHKGGKTQKWHHGIMAHQRFPDHGDGHVYEYFVLARVLGLSPKKAFFATVAGLSHRGVKSHGPLKGRANHNLTFWPNYQGPTNVGSAKGYVKAGELMWDMSNLIEEDINSHVPGTSLFDIGKFDKWYSSKRGQAQRDIAKKINPKAGWTEKTLKRKTTLLGVASKPEVTAGV